ncbi:MAG: hypothetical protein ACRDSF_21220 [Pseudonocardiaceae bacterium]
MSTGPALSPTGRYLKAKRAVLTRHRGPDHPETIEADRDYRAEVLAEHIREVVDTAPPLSAEQIEQLRGLLPAPVASATGTGSDREATSA